jgi:hypothetical protein
MALTIHVNVGTGDIAKGESGADYVEMNLTYDRLIFSAGSDVVKDGEPIPSSSELNSAALLISAKDVEVVHFFLADASVSGGGLLREIHNMGNQNKRYVLCFAFTTATASEPVLEIWDDEDLDSVNDYCLGEGVANNSFFRGITTTGALPGSRTWSRLAGSGVGHFLNLNDGVGALTVATDLYCTLRITILKDFSNAKFESPVLCVKWTTN